MILAGVLIAVFSAALLILAAIAFLRAKDVFMMTHITMIANFYIIPLILIGIELERFSWLSFAKILALIVLNLVVTSLLCNAISRRAVINKILPDAEREKS
jgi:multisubunit Na+/H+ antiporter MnhG subunit